MKPVTEYMDYREYIRDYYTERKAFGFSWNAFASSAGFSSPVFLQYVCEAKKNLSEKTASQVASAMGLVGYEMDFFKLLVAYGNAKDDKSKKAVLGRISVFAETHRVRVTGADEYEFFKSWKNSVVREIAPALPGATHKQLSIASRRRIPTAEIAKILDFLLQSGYLEVDENGCYHQVNRSLKMSGEQNTIRKSVARDLQRQMTELALDALENETPENRNMTGLMLGITRDKYDQVVQELAECRRRIVAIAASDDATEEVYRLNMQLFPLTDIGSVNSTSTSRRKK
ncbi:TIGR02147 family protein [uncultured Fibrobacter sp.]|uniref:TIGR02147 family protein n=1 Tax=uncultured Fibrobacter sp. TaxID=261512 RepID=UPI002603F8D1|nr:TIGR02147 family protein [uncultured Fibrobacter sp.]